MSEEVNELDEEIIEEQLSNLRDNEARNLINAIKSYLKGEDCNPLEGHVADLFEYFKILPNKHKSIFLFIFKCAKKEKSELNALLEEVNFVFQKKHIMSIFAEVNNMPEDFQKIWYDNIYIDLAPRYECILEKNGKTRK